MSKYYVVDLHREQKFGPYATRDEARKVRTIVRLIPDLFLETASNVGLVHVNTKPNHDAFPYTDFRNFAVGDLNDVKRQNANLS